MERYALRGLVSKGLADLECRKVRLAVYLNVFVSGKGLFECRVRDGRRGLWLRHFIINMALTALFSVAFFTVKVFSLEAPIFGEDCYSCLRENPQNVFCKDRKIEERTACCPRYSSHYSCSSSETIKCSSEYKSPLLLYSTCRKTSPE